MKGHDHWYYDLAPQINRDAWDFLKRHELNEDPRYETYDHTSLPAQRVETISAVNESQERDARSLSSSLQDESERRAGTGE